MLDEEDHVQANEWRQVVRKAKKYSISSIFSIKDYSVYECALESERIVEVLIQFYNIVIKHNHYPIRWIKVADVILEK